MGSVKGMGQGRAAMELGKGAVKGGVKLAGKAIQGVNRLSLIHI